MEVPVRNKNKENKKIFIRNKKKSNTPLKKCNKFYKLKTLRSTKCSKFNSTTYLCNKSKIKKKNFL